MGYHNYEMTMTDLRELVEHYLGKPLAASTSAALWHCPVCAPPTSCAAHGLGGRVQVFERLCL